ncbi:unnamed protein product [Urochloa humidicola]
MKRAREDETTDVMQSPNDLLHVHGREEEEDDDENGHRSAAASHDSAFLTQSSSSLSSAAEPAASTAAAAPPHNNKRSRSRRRALVDAFECRTCGRRFATFQALGGHRTSHLRRPPAATKHLRPKQPVVAHACSAYGLGFPTGQALGGHMRRHRRVKCMDSDDVGLTQIIVYDRPRSASLQLLDLFV